MKKLSWRSTLGLTLVGASVLLYLIHFAVFGDFHHIMIYLVGDIAFLPVEVLLVTIVLHRLLEKKAKESLLGKMNMVIGAFFSEAGNDLLRMLGESNSDLPKHRELLVVRPAWTDGDFARSLEALEGLEARFSAEESALAELKTFLAARRNFLLRLLENPNLLEHDEFSDLLWAVFHLMEELGFRRNVGELSQADRAHLALDMKRAWNMLVTGWIKHLRHLRRDYPYLYSLAVRANPFDPEARVEIV